MEFHWFDHLTRRLGPQQFPSLKVLREFAVATDAREVNNISTRENCIVLVHHGDDYETDWQRALDDGQGFIISFSSHPEQLVDRAPRGYCFTRRFEDFATSGDLELFVQSCRDGAPMWGLLKQPDMPAHALGLLLIEIARRYTGDTSVGAGCYERLLHGAEEEFRARLSLQSDERMECLRRMLGDRPHRMISVLTVGQPAAAIARGRLKHSWLENEVLNKTEEDVVWLRRSGEWPELQRFQADAAEAVDLAGHVIQGFSPSQLVDLCRPLLGLSASERAAVRDAVHHAYQEVFDAHASASKLRSSGERMVGAVQSLLVEWQRTDHAHSEAVLRSLWRNLLDAAAELRLALDELPRGVVLP